MKVVLRSFVESLTRNYYENNSLKLFCVIVELDYVFKLSLFEENSLRTFLCKVRFHLFW